MNKSADPKSLRARLAAFGFNRRSMLFAGEGMIWHFIAILVGTGTVPTNLYASYMGASDSQIALIPMACYLASVALMVPLGILADRMKNAKTVPILMSSAVGAVLLLFASVPAMGSLKLPLFFAFIAIEAGIIYAYNSAWQAFFGDMTGDRERTGIYAMRFRGQTVLGIVAPIITGSLLSAMPDVPSKTMLLRAYFYLCAALSFFYAWYVYRMPGGERSPQRLAEMQKSRLTLKGLGEVFADLAKSRRFRFFMICVMFYYFTWLLDSTAWYLAQINFLHMNEAELSLSAPLISVASLLGVSLFTKTVERKGPEFGFLIPIALLVFCPLYGMLTIYMPAGIRVTMFLTGWAVLNAGQGLSAMCLLQMLLRIAPENNRSLVVSVSTAACALVNAFAPYVGVSLFNLLGGDLRGLWLFSGATVVLRAACLAVNALRWRSVAREENAN